MSAETMTEDEALDFYANKGTALALSTDAIDQECIPAAFDYLKSEIGIQGDNIPTVYAAGPREAWNVVRKHLAIPDEEEFPFIEPGYQGNLHARLLAWSGYHRDISKVDFKDTGIDQFAYFAERLHYVFTLEEVFVFCDRPIADRRKGISSVRGPDGKGVITGDLTTANYDRHCEDGPALEYADGTKAWFIDGVMVDEKIVLRPHEQSLKEIQEDTDNDRRRIRIARYGWPRFLRECGAIAQDTALDRGEALFELASETYNLFVCIDASSPDLVCLPIEKAVASCVEAQRWLAAGNNWNIVAAT